VSAPADKSRATTPGRETYAEFTTLDTRWLDNDVYGHVNNVQYYSFFDTAVNRWLIERGVLDPVTSPVFGLVVETRCSYFKPVTFPERVEAGLKVAHLGRSSVRYEIGLFRKDDPEAAAAGEFTHVYVDRQTRRPAAIPDAFRAALETLKR
jgi:acyl-CoA thioester hydrolase